MSVDKNLFLYDLAVVAIMKNEGPYVKEWLDYHLLAGVDHFFIFDNESEDNLKKILQPYIDKGIVTYEFLPGQVMQSPAYNLAINRFRFYCRYIAFIDTDEFILPKSSSNIVGVVDEIFSYHESIAGLVINWHCFGSNYQDKADYSKGVLERFTRRAPNDWTPKVEGWPEHLRDGNAVTKTILNPRKVKYMDGPHNGVYFENCYMVNEQGRALPSGNNHPVTADKIVLNHYNTKTREEYTLKIRRGSADGRADEPYCNDETFKFYDRNEEFDDEILKYRDARRSALIPKGGGAGRT